MIENDRDGDNKMPKFAQAHAVVVAVANYTDVNPLPEAVLNDAHDVAAVLSAANYCGYDPKQITTLLDDEATLGTIRQALTDLASASRPDDTAFIFFSGHGARLNEEGTETSVLLPVDCRYDDLPGTTLSEAEFSRSLSAIPAKRLVVVLDACHSGGAGSLKQTSSANLEQGLDEKALQRLAQGTGRVIIASSRATETSLVMKGARNSVFTERLLEALRGEARTHGDGLIRVFEVFNYVSEKVRGAVPGRQHPIFKASDPEENFPLALDRGGAKAVGKVAPGASTPWRQLEEIMADLYPAGPLDQEIWARAGGDVSRLSLSGTGRAIWFAALRTLRQGGGGQNISKDSLLLTALEDFPHHPELQALKSDA
jgi:metacaspase-1